MLQAAAGILAQHALGKLRDRIRPNPFAPNIPDQAALAAAQSVGRFRSGTSGLAGSETDWYADGQGHSTVGFLAIAQDLPSARRPASMFVAGDPGAGPEPTVLRDVRRGPVERLSNAQGAATRTVNTRHQHVIPSTLLPPTFVPPTAQDMAQARAAGAPQGAQDALADYWGD